MRDGRFYRFWIYIVGSLTGTLYVGVTGFFNSRLRQHKEGLPEGFTKKYGCNRLLYYEVYDDINKALAREKQLRAGDGKRNLP